MVVRRGTLLAVSLACLLGTVACGQAQQPAPAAAQPGPQAAQPGAQPAQGQGAAQQPAPAKRWDAPPPMSLKPGAKYSAVVHTNFGDFTIELFADKAPKTVNNFVFLARQRFYEGSRFFRIIQPFMVQTGDPTNLGTGGPGYRFADELPPPYPYDPGIVAMANAGANTNGSQFFICTGPAAAGLNKLPNYTQFGKVTSGMSVVEKIAAIPVQPNPMMGGEPSKPTQDAHITGIDIVEK